MSSQLPVIGITVGDPAGIGPEVVFKALSVNKISAECVPVVICDSVVAQDVAERYGVDFRVIKNIGEIEVGNNNTYLLDLKNIDKSKYKIGSPNAETGRASLEWVERCAKLCVSGGLDGMATGPISKQAVCSAGFIFRGHTEFLAKITGARKFIMMMVSDRLKVGLVTTHLSLKKAVNSLSIELIVNAAMLTSGIMPLFGIKKPRIAVAGLNPHCGEGGIFGNEEIKIIKPAVDVLKMRRINVTGPLSPDTVFRSASKGDYDAVVAMYHDQGLIPFKMIGFEKGVNVTVGLPIIRTSVDHGTACDIAGKGVADETSMVNAIKTAAIMARNRGERQIEIPV